MTYLQCRASLTEADEAEQVWLDARAVFECDYDLQGHMTHGR
jgi:hypothetical protein